MGTALLDTDPELFDRYLGLADEASGLPIRRYVEGGPIEELTRTDVAQPALFAVALALNEVARELGLRPAFVAGHSLGEWTAAVAGGALELEDGMRLVCERGRLMAEVQSVRPGSMAAIIGLDPDAVYELCDAAADTGTVVPANFNSPSQIVVSGETAAVERAIELAKERGAKRARALRVGAAFHSPLMEAVQARLGEALSETEVRDSEVPLASNATGALVREAGEVRDALVTQIGSPLRWVECVQTLVGAGCTRFLELGPGRVLTDLVRKIDEGVEASAADSRERLDELVGAAPR